MCTNYPDDKLEFQDVNWKEIHPRWWQHLKLWLTFKKWAKKNKVESHHWWEDTPGDTVHDDNYIEDKAENTKSNLQSVHNSVKADMNGKTDTGDSVVTGDNVQLDCACETKLPTVKKHKLDTPTSAQATFLAIQQISNGWQPSYHSTTSCSAPTALIAASTSDILPSLTITTHLRCHSVPQHHGFSTSHLDYLPCHFGLTCVQGNPR
ncbi:hypothetical protein FRC08_018469 [Ceratobasidium sp. 394]|nr:hypothetical protein FRC08_018469 [Ceratobasidium sp. 394]